MSAVLVRGAVVAVVAALAVALGDAIGLGLSQAALPGILLGAVVASIPTGSPLGRIIGLLVGVVLGAISYALRAGVLPDTDTGRGIAAFIVLAVAVVVAIATANRVAWWSIALGIVALNAVYEATFSAAPARFLDHIGEGVTSTLLACIIGIVAGLSVATRPTASHVAETNEEALV